MDPLVVRPDVVLPARDLSFTASRSSGPGGQNVNKTASKVDLAFDLAGTLALADDVKARLRALAASRLDEHGALHVTSQLTRDQPKNLADAREKLRALVLRALERPKARRKTKATRGSVERRLADKRRTSEKKGRRGRADD